MKLHRRAAFLLGVLLLASSAFARQLPNIDAFANAKPNPANDAAAQARARDFIRGGSQLRTEGRLGVPTFVWAGAATGTPTIHVGGNSTNLPPEEAAARSFVGTYASLYNLNAADVTTAAVRDVHNTGKGGVIVKFKQTVGGIEIFREELNVLMTQKLELVALSGYISSATTPAAVGGGLGFTLDNRTAASGAFADLTGRSLGSLVAAGSRGGYDLFTAGAGAGLDEPMRVKKVFFHVAGGLIPGYYVEVAAKDQGTSTDGLFASDEAPGLDYYSYVISAADGSVLFRKNLTNDAKEHGKLQSNGFNDYTYRVWASNTTFIPQDEPFGNDVTPKVNPIPDGFQPPYIGATDVTLTNYPSFSRAGTDPWLPPGATVTNGNNVDAYVDLDGLSNGANDGFTGSDFRAAVTAPGQFLHTFDPTIAPTSNEQRQAALQQLFYNDNFLHDWYYDYGFDEAAGNAQALNFGRGGVEGDSMRAEGQDGSGRNNA
ncbi:MAG TPA: M36 family metallopeptidase, partial [Thermoanaerobaculia bacterium]|nr:M36 family metallopeptidase [Thermoanaerobaculia bacterium]